MPLYYSWVTLAACELCCFCEPITDFHLLPLLAIAWDFDAHTQQCSSSETSVVRTMSFCLILKMILNSSVLSDYYGFIESEISHRRRRHTNILNLVTWELTVRSRVSFFGTIHFQTWRVIVRVFFSDSRHIYRSQKFTERKPKWFFSLANIATHKLKSSGITWRPTTGNLELLILVCLQLVFDHLITASFININI